MSPDAPLKDNLSRDLRHALALSISVPDQLAMGLDRDNRGRNWLSIEEAVRSGECFMVAVSPDVLAIDCDDDREDGPARRAIDSIAAELIAKGSRPVVLASGGGRGRVHLFCRMTDPRSRSEAARVARARGLDVREGGSRIRPPLTVHRSGAQPYFIDPQDRFEALDALRPHPPWQSLSRRMQTLLETGGHDGRYESRSEVVQALVVASAAAGWAEAEIAQALMDPGNKGGEKVQEILLAKGSHSARAYVRASWEKAIVRVALNPSVRALDVEWSLAGLRSAAEAAPWRGLAGSSQHAVIQTLLSIASMAKSLEFTASVRQMAEMAGLSERATMKALRVLQPDWIELKERGHGRTASLWKLQPPRDDTNRTHTPLQMRVNGVESTLLSHDAFRHLGLGKNAAWICSNLTADRGSTVKELSDALAPSEATIRRQLKRLEEVGLARQSDRYWFRLERDLDDVARDLGTLGTGERHVLRNQLQREGYRAHVLRRFSWAGRSIDATTGEVLGEGRGVA